MLYIFHSFFLCLMCPYHSLVPYSARSASLRSSATSSRRAGEHTKRGRARRTSSTIFPHYTLCAVPGQSGLVDSMMLCIRCNSMRFYSMPDPCAPSPSPLLLRIDEGRSKRRSFRSFRKPSPLLILLRIFWALLGEAAIK